MTTQCKGKSASHKGEGGYKAQCNPFIVFLVPCYIPLINPGLELDFVGALIPCYNLALITNNLIAGTVDWFLYSIALISTIVYCCVAIYITYMVWHFIEL